MARPEEGAAAVEMALIMPVLFMLLFGIIVFGLHLFRLQAMESAVREGGRLAAIGSSTDVIAQRVLSEQQVVPKPSSPPVFGSTLTGGKLVATAAGIRVSITKTAGAALSAATAPCVVGDAAAGARVQVEAAVVDPAAYGLSIPFLPGPIAPDFKSSASFRCEN